MFRLFRHEDNSKKEHDKPIYHSEKYKQFREEQKKRMEYLEYVLFSKECSKEERDKVIKELQEKERKRKEEEERIAQECIKRLGYEGVDLDAMESEGYRKHMKNYKYIHDYSAPAGSIDNPIEVGMEGCCTSLVFAPTLGGWVLTDGLGHGVSR